MNENFVMHEDMSSGWHLLCSKAFKSAIGVMRVIDPEKGAAWVHLSTY